MDIGGEDIKIKIYHNQFLCYEHETLIHEQNFIIPKNRPVWGDFFVLYYLELLICDASKKSC